MKIALLGDMAFLGKYDISTKDNDAKKRFQYIKEIIKDCDFAIANLECVLSLKTKTTVCKGAYLRANPENAELLKYIGITHVTLANNHIGDFGKKGLNDTVSTLNEYGISFVGINNGPALLQKGEDSALLEGFCCYSSNGVIYGNKYGNISVLSQENVEKFLKNAKSKKCLPIVSAHFGVEQVHYPSVEHIKMFRKLTEINPYVLHGNHPHCIQGYESVNNSVLFYALGNLCFDTVTKTSIKEVIVQTERNRKTFCTILNIEKDKLVDYQLIPITDMPDGVLSPCDEIYDELNTYSSKLAEDFHTINTARKNDMHNNRKKQTLNARFICNRLNYKYLGAYLNGKLHAKKYKKLFGEWMQ